MSNTMSDAKMRWTTRESIIMFPRFFLKPLIFLLLRRCTLPAFKKDQVLLFDLCKELGFLWPLLC
jgi:hypothetical protein